MVGWRTRSRRVFYGAVALGVLASAYLVGSVTLGGALAGSVEGDAANCGPPPYVSSVQRRGAEPAARLATVTPEQAAAAALVRFPGGRVTEIELEDEHGSVVYEVEVKDAADTSHDVVIDAGTAEVLHVEAEDAEETEAVEEAGCD